MNGNNILSPLSYKAATGEIPFNMTNDYMFRIILQKHSVVLKDLICALLHLKLEDIESANITNPIELGEDIDDKTFVLDIDVMLNNNALLNLEMQMSNEHNWQDRSLSYLCRSFDQLYQGESYSSAKPAIHIGFLNFHPHMEAAAQALYEANADEMTKRKCRARRDYYKQKNTTEKMLHELTEAIEQKKLELEQKDSALAQKDSALAQKDSALAQKDSELKQKDFVIEQKEARIKELEALLKNQA